ncbi:SAF domain-containing protein [Microbacterium sp.]|uniref:SAF domain-containing protein n=1 Tax=Microbacterium sp. TaxID=51671 RepID=UPI0039E6C9F2
MAALDVIARPRPRPFWSDLRFLLGIVLIVASVAGVWLVVSTARQTAPVLVATRTIVPGQQVSAGDLEVAEVALGGVGEAYAVPGTLADDAVATRTIAAGELVPADAVGDAREAATTTVVMRSATDVPASVRPGTVVEVWAAPPTERGEYDTPRVLVADATVVQVSRDDSMLGGGEVALELVIARADVAAALAASSDGSALSVVPVAGTASTGAHR